MTAVEPLQMRQTMGKFVTGVAVITALDVDGMPHGMTVNSLTSVSLDPPLILVCFTEGARTASAVTRSGRFAASVLGARQEAIARRFAARGDDHFGELALSFGEHQVPVVPNALAHVECQVSQAFTAGDHVVVIGEVQRTCRQEGRALAFLNGRFGDFADRGHDQLPWFF